MTKRYLWLPLLLLVAVALNTREIRSQAQAAPVLLVVNSASTNPFGPYLGEILKAEGINSFSVADLSTVSSTSLADVKLVVLAETALTDGQATTLSNFVAGGGRLVAMRPDSRLNSTLGITGLGTTQNNGYLQIDAASATGTGFTTTTLPFQGTANNYTLGGGASALATLFSSQTTSTGRPAVVRSGRTATWAYDLARSVAYARQGNPANAGVDRDGLPPLRTNDVFYNAIDKDRVSLPHADIQMRLLARVITDLLADATPLPILWYYPGGAKTLLVVTSDSHANPQTWFDDFFTAVNARNVKASLYINGGATPSVGSVQTWRSQGHEVGMHPAGNQNGQTLDQAYQANFNYFVTGGYGNPSPTTRNHQVEWLGWADAATVAANRGVALDTSFYTWGPAVTYTNGTQAHGYINGSSRAMRFVNQAGTIIPEWQLSTSLVDEQLIVGSFSENMTGAQALAVSQQLIDASQAGDYSTILTQFHIDYFSWGDVNQWALGTMDYANSLGIPNRTAEGLLNYTTNRAATGITGVTWQAGPRQLSFTAAVPLGSEPQTLTVPSSFAGNALVDVQINGTVVPVTTQTITGRSLAMFAVSPSAAGVDVVVTYAGGTPAVRVSDVTVLEGTGGATSATFTLTLSPAAAVPVTVSYATSNGTAVAPADYTAASASVTFPAGTTSRTVAVAVVPDSTFESDETFILTLSNPTNATISDATGIATIVNDDAPPPGLSIGDVAVLEGQSGSATAGLTVTLSPAASGTVTVNWATQNGTATGGSDFTAASGILTFPAGTTTQTIPVTVTGDTAIEPDETFTVVLSNAVGSAIVDGSGTVTVLNDDAVPTIGTLVRTTRDDFACSVLTNAILTQASNGEVRLAGTFGDEFANSTLASTWTARTWAGGNYSPAITGGVLQIANASGAYVRSTAAVPVTTIDARVQFTAAAWEHVGWAALDFDGPYMIFSTFNTTNTLYARSNTGGGEQTTSLGPIPTGTHSYRIERVPQGATDQIVYSIDGTVVATHTVGAAPAALYVYLSHNGGTAPTLNVDSLWVYPGHIAGTGSIESCSLDAGSVVPWTTATWTSQTPSGTTLGMRVRTSVDGSSWSPWANLLASGQAIGSPAGRYLQFGADLTSTNGTASPVLESVTFGYGDDGIPTVSASSVSLLEGASGVTNAVFNVTLNHDATQVVTVDFATADGTAAAGSDYVSTAGTLTFPVGAVAQTVSVPVIGDGAVESNETFTLVLGGATNARVGTNGTGTILNDDVPPPNVTVSGVSVLEGNAGSVTATATISLSAASLSTVTVNWATQDGTATAGSDYVASSGTATFAPGITSVAVPVSITADTAVEAAETLTVVLSGATGGAITTASATITILNDDAVPTAGTFARTSRSDFACYVPTNTIVTRRIDGEVRLAGPFGDEFNQASLGSQWVAGTWAGGAYTPAISGGVMSIAGANGAFVRSANMQLMTTLDAEVAFTGTAWQHVGWADLDFNGAFAIFSTFNTTDTLFARSNSSSGSQLTNLGPIPTGVHNFRIDRVTGGSGVDLVYSIDNVVVATHTLASVPASLYVYTSHNGGTAPALNIDAVQVYPAYAATGSYESCTLDAGAQVNWTQATWAAQVPTSTTLGVRTRTSVDGLNWSAWLPLLASGQVVASPAGRYLQYGFDMTSANVAATPVVESFTVGYGDPLPNLSVANTSVNEGNTGTTNAVFTLTLDIAPAQPVSVNYATSAGTAVAGTDFVNTTGTATFASGVTTQTVTVPVNGDIVFESNETLGLTLSGATNAIIVGGLATGTILNDDAQPAISINSVALAEGNAGTQNAVFTVSLSNPSAFTTTVAYATANGSATAGSDYTATSGVLTFAPEVTTQTVSVPVAGDGTFEANETFAVNLTAPSGATIAVAQGVGTITNDDAAPSFSITNASVTEGNLGTQTMTFAVTLNGATALPATVAYATANGSATAGSDYTATSGTLTFNPGGATTQNVQVTISGDTLYEVDETFTVNLSSATNATIATPSGTGTILNNDVAPNLAIGNATVTEGNTGTVNANFTVTLSAATGAVTTVNYATSDISATAGADYVATSGTLTFTPGGPLTQTITVPVIGETRFEVNETFRVTLSGAVNAGITTAQGTGTINNDDVQPSISATGVSVTEGTGGTTTADFTVTLSAVSGVTATVNYTTAPNTATATTDYTTTSGTLTFAPGVTTQTISVPLVEDALFEANETFFVNFSAASGASLATTQVTGTIVNDDAAPTITVGPATVLEGGTFAFPTLSFPVTLSAASGLTTSFTFSTANGTATAGSDYTSRTGVAVNIPAGSTTGTFTVTVTGDTTPEADETVLINLSGATNGTLAQTQVTGTITNDDGAVTVNAPNTNVLWTVGQTQSITWSTSGFPALTATTWRIELSRDGGTTWTTLSASTATNILGNGTFNWTVTGPASTTNRVRISWTGNANVTDISNVNFRIQ